MVATAPRSYPRVTWDFDAWVLWQLMGRKCEAPAGGRRGSAGRSQGDPAWEAGVRSELAMERGRERHLTGLVVGGQQNAKDYSIVASTVGKQEGRTLP